MNRPCHNHGKSTTRAHEMSANRPWSVFLSVTQVLVVLITCLLIAVRLSLPGIGQFRSEVEQWISAATGRSISIGFLEATWRGWTPELAMKDIRLRGANEDTSHIQSLRVRVGFDPFAFWKATGIHIKKLLLSGISLTITRKSNGSLRLTGIGILPSSKKPESEGVLSWLLHQPHVDMESASIRWRDEENENASFFMQNAHFSIRRNGTRHRIHMRMHSPKGTFAKAPTPGTSGGLLSGVADIAVNPTTLDWSGNAFLQVEGFDLDRLPFLQNILASLGVSGPLFGAASFGFWTFWNKGQLERVKGDFKARDLVLWDTNSNSAAYEWYPDLAMERKDRRFPTHKGNRIPPVEGCDELSKGDGCASSRAPAKKISFPGIGGYLELDRIGSDDWQLRLRRFSLSTPHGEWPATHARLKIVWSRNHHGWLLKVRDAKLENEDIILRLMGAGQWFEDDSLPELRLVMGIEHGRLDRLDQYLPTSLMKDSLVEWLLRAFPKGELVGGKILFHGRIADFPFDNGKGVFEVRAETSHETTLDYAESWPLLKKLKTEIVFSGRGFAITANSGSVYGIGIEKVIAEIPDILAETPILNVHGHLVGRLDRGLAFLREGPLGEQYASRIAGLEGKGKHRLELKIRLPLAGDEKIRTQGNITFLNDTLDINTPWIVAPKADSSDITLEYVNGILTFDTHGIVGKSITARYLDRPITLDIATITDPKDTTRFTIAGIDTDTLLANPSLKTAARKLSPSLWSFAMRVMHKATWRIMLDLPNDWMRGERPARLQFVSRLRGATVDLPPPLTDRPFLLEALLSVGDRKIREKSKQDVRFRFGSEVRGIFSTGKSGKWRAAARLGAGPIRLPEKGIRIDGHIPRLSFGKWRPLLASLAEAHSISGMPRAPTRSSLLEGIPDFQAEISTDEFSAFSRTLRNAKFKVRQDDDGNWHIQVRSDALQGHLRIPRFGAKEIIAVSLTHLRLPLARIERAGDDFDPKNIPPMRFSCEHLTYGARALGRIELLELARNPQGLAIEDIKIKSRDFRINGSGNWERSAQSDQSRFHIEIDGPDLGKLLSSFGYEGNVTEEGKTHIELDAQWLGSPTQFELARVNGSLHVRVSDGRLLAIKPGATGRVFGLLSVTLLPRRLLLDFSDLFQEGLVYDRMEGNFRIHEGKAETKDFFVEGPTSRVDIEGNTGLINKDYDQIATVIPKLASSIPLAAIGVAQKLFDSPFFDRIFSYQYTIKGTWDDPKIEPAEGHAEENHADDDEMHEIEG
uniref:TIGR02099 family protein n=1 Tax=Candidatus Kentrum sp. SD TaxID=2126332 RepID=A0A451BJ87_9GAMM|nr:MAG: TIGR02099 family protein [Candidatus Kentron sp. SD]